VISFTRITSAIKTNPYIDSSESNDLDFPRSASILDQFDQDLRASRASRFKSVDDISRGVADDTPKATFDRRSLKMRLYIRTPLPRRSVIAARDSQVVSNIKCKHDPHSILNFVVVAFVARH
jgi:hypothetical protein